MASRRTLKKHSPEALLAKLASSDPETRWLAAGNLATHGDRSTIVPLEQVALADSDLFSREGAFVDTTEAPYLAAFEALTSVYARHPPSREDVARVRASLANPEVAANRAESLAATLGTAAAEMAEPLLLHTDATIRLRATNAIAHARKLRSNHALWVDDEDVRLAATQQDAYRARLVPDALERFADEPSTRVRRGICDLWLRYRARMGGSLNAHELADLLVSPDPEIHAPVGQHVLDSARRSASPWTYNPVGFRAIRKRLAAMLAHGDPTTRAPILQEVLTLIDTSLAPFPEPADVPAATASRPRAPPTLPVPAPTTAAATVAAEEEEWSVLTAPLPNLPERARSAMLTIGRERRAALSRTIGTAVLRELDRMIAPWFSRGMRDHAAVDVFHASLRGDTLVLHFVADHDNYNFAQSGSDWDDHYVFAGEAELAGDEIAKLAFALERHVHLTEQEHEHYDSRVIRDLVRDELRAHHSGSRADQTAFDVAVERVREANRAGRRK